MLQVEINPKLGLDFESDGNADSRTVSWKSLKEEGGDVLFCISKRIFTKDILCNKQSTIVRFSRFFFLCSIRRGEA